MRCFVVRGGRAKPLWAGHPWVYADTVDEVEPRAVETDEGDDDVALVLDGQDRAIGCGFVSDASALRIRLLDRGPPRVPVSRLLETAVRRACAARRRLFPAPRRTNAYRLVHAEGDDLPGLVVDRYADVLVAQFSTRPMHRRRSALASLLLGESGARSLVARAGGFEAEEGIAEGDVPFAFGDDAPARIRVVEEGMVLDVEPLAGQKTGHYTDQRENRLRVAELASGAQILDLYAGTAGFSVQALRHGARTSLAVETSRRAVEAAARTARLNGVAGDLEVTCGDVRETLRALKQAERRFDVVVLDPPSFFPRRGGGGSAVRAYRDLNVQALTRVAPGGVLATFTCSHRLDPGAWRELVLSSARECRRTLRVLRELTAGPDHPVLGAASEGRYLSGLLVTVDPEAAYVKMS